METKKPVLPSLLQRKIYKTGQTRGAENDEIFQNRVSRNSTVLIRYDFWEGAIRAYAKRGYFQNGYIVLIPPDRYFERIDRERYFKNKDLELGINFLVFYQTRDEWNKYNPEELGWSYANSRTPPLQGNYVARVPGITSKVNGKEIFHGFSDTPKGAGIRLYEYATKETLMNTGIQLEALFWMCFDSIDVVTKCGMNSDDAVLRKKLIIEEATKKNLLNILKLREMRIINESDETICPLCLEKISAWSFFTKVQQAEGRDVPDLTVTDISLFHIHELRYGEFNHKPYNLGWGHYFCNVVAKDAGIEETLNWMKKVLNSNGFSIKN